MSTMITITTSADEDFKTVVLVCYDRKSGKYRSLNLAKRVLAAQEYDSPEQLISVFQTLKDKGQIVKYEVITNNHDKKD